MIYRLHQYVVLAEQEGGSGILMKRLHIVSGGGGGRCPFIHTTTGVSFLNLNTHMHTLRTESNH